MSQNITETAQYFKYYVESRTIKVNPELEELGFPIFESNQQDLNNEWNSEKTYWIEEFKKQSTIDYSGEKYGNTVKTYFRDIHNIDTDFLDVYSKNMRIPIIWEDIFIIGDEFFKMMEDGLSLEHVMGAFLPSPGGCVILSQSQLENYKQPGMIEEILIHEFFHKNSFGQYLKIKVRINPKFDSYVDYNSGWRISEFRNNKLRAKNNFFEEGLATIVQIDFRRKLNRVNNTASDNDKLVLRINDGYYFAMESIFKLDLEVLGLKLLLLSARESTSDMVKAINMMNGYCEGLYDFLGNLDRLEFKRGLEIVEKVILLKKQNLNVKIINGEVIVKE
jgi:hypothetical protein